MTIGAKIISTVMGSGLFFSLAAAATEFASSLASDLIAASVSLVLG